MILAPGFLLIRKPVDVTSTTCVTLIKKIIRNRNIKIGHTGTLDSFATGLLIIGIGRAATRHIAQIMELDKQYTATGQLGILTTTYDFTGTTISETAPPEINQENIMAAIKSFGSAYPQTPPIYSALKHNGKRLSSLARGTALSTDDLQKIASYKQRTIQLFNVQLTALTLPFFTIHAHVSHGTYIRSFVQDIAQRLDTNATTYQLERTHIGPFALGDAQPLDELTSIEAIMAHLIAPEIFLARLRTGSVSETK